MKIAISGLGRMGGQIARKLHEAGHSVIVHNRSRGPIEELAALGMIPAFSPEEVVSSFGDDQVVLWLMVPSEVIGEELAKWLKIIPPGSIIIDGGNSDYRLTAKRALVVKEQGSTLIDVGTSGGVFGYKNGFSMMVGGEKESFLVIEPVLKSLAAPEGAYHFFGSAGAGHFVKMTHNAIEYGMMESLAEGYHLLKSGPYPDLDLAAAGEVWQHHSVITSWLNELTRDYLQVNPKLDDVSGFVAESGEARWALEAAKTHQVDMPSIQAAFDVRVASQQGKVSFATKLLAAMRNSFGGHKLNQ